MFEDEPEDNVITPDWSRHWPALAAVDPGLRVRAVDCKKTINEDKTEDHSNCEHFPVTNAMMCGKWVLERRVPPQTYDRAYTGPRPEYILEFILQDSNGVAQEPDVHLINHLSNPSNDLLKRYKAEFVDPFTQHLLERRDTKRKEYQDWQVNAQDAICDATKFDRRMIHNPFISYRPSEVFPGTTFGNF